ncbi:MULTISPECIES: hypothetical protein [Vibrio]|uniref:hypothetical protein n=1 Tax=Vibrio TaxID=662 RepID=UPI00207560DD|nr:MULTISPECIES: hypothetical protein [Vibrio]USD35567.1 hypothetical protein J8Z27_22405 [Vibrio sp. SCSIO 43186]USD72691.1 hypothetical protein J4N41_22420 [Vibrio sp. SCSIO 43139]USD98907.1 hypothetical protein CTT30_22760 [Vibrio coralliilyticus]
MNEMITYVLSHESVLSALITGSFAVVAAAIPSAILYRLSIRYMRTKQTEHTCLSALEELEFKNAVIATLREKPQLTLKQAIEVVNKEHSLFSTQLFTPSKLQSKLRTYRRKVERSAPML